MRTRDLQTDAVEFQPALIRLQEKPPSPLGRAVLWALLGFLALLLAWGMLARLDIVAVAEGKLVPTTYLKIVQPAEQGVIREILVREGQSVRAGEILMRMDTTVSEADAKSVRIDYEDRRLALRRIDAQLAGRPYVQDKDDPPALFAQAQAQYAANVRAYQSMIAEERSVLDKAGFDLAAAEEIRSKLLQVLPHYREQEQAFERLVQEGHVTRIQYTDKQRERIEREQDLKSQEFIMASARATISQAERRIVQVGAEYERQLRAERVEVAAQLEKLGQELAKQQHRRDYLELRAPENGIIKDLATHTVGAVTSPGTVLMTLVPKNETLRAEVWVRNDDVGFVRPTQSAKIKLATFLFQKYGMLNGKVLQVSADASDPASDAGEEPTDAGAVRPLAYRTLIELNTQALEHDGARYALLPGMRVSAEIKLGTRSVMEYLFSPVTKAFHEAGRER